LPAKAWLITDVPSGVSTQAGANISRAEEGATTAMTMLAENLTPVIDAVIGVDTHTDTHTACLIDKTGRELAIVTAEATPRGYAWLLAWASQHAAGQVLWAVEGTRSHGAGLARALTAAGQQVSAYRPTCTAAYG
jgi:transposase